MSSPAVEFVQVSKRFQLHYERPRSFQEIVTGLFRKNRHSAQEFWPLRDVSFGVAPGEAVGLIGANGAGKSTVLKLVSRIIDPTSGAIKVNGRVAGLLELGTGFHPDLTGRENIYLNGSILGLSRREIKQRLDSIIEFAEIPRFIDIPVRNYSSGMLMRLGFSVATSFQPDILLIDEVLAVGDQGFQAKCLQRITHIQESGVTILLVSHNLDTVRRVCQRAIWLEEGQVRTIGATDQVVLGYLSQTWKNTNIRLLSEGDPVGRGRRWGSGEAVITQVEFLDAAGNACRVFQTGNTFRARMRYRAFTQVRQPTFGIAIHRDDGVHVTGPNTTQAGHGIDAIDGDGIVEYVIDALPLLPGQYEFTAAIYDRHSVHPYDHQHRAFTFKVQAGGVEAEGLVNLPGRWESHSA